MDGLQADYGERITFYHVDTDDPAQRQVSDRFGVWGHSQYVLLDGEGAILHQWNGYLQGSEVSAVFEAVLAR